MTNTTTAPAARYVAAYLTGTPVLPRTSRSPRIHVVTTVDRTQAEPRTACGRTAVAMPNGVHAGKAVGVVADDLRNLAETIPGWYCTTCVARA